MSVSAFPVGPFAAGSPAAILDTFTVATWNIAGARTVASTEHRYDYCDEECIAAFAQQLARIAPNVVCLQESHFMHDSNTSALEHATGMRYSYDVPMHASHIDPQQKLAIAIMADCFFEAEKVRLPDPRFPIRFNGEPVEPLPRKLLLARFDEGLAVATVHTNPDEALGFSYESGVGATHARDLEALFLARLQGAVILAGDLNTDDPRKVYPRLFEELGLREALPDEPTVPWGGRPDHILYSEAFTLLESGVLPWHADHYLGWARFRRPAPAPD